MQWIGAILKSPNRYQQPSTVAFAICVSVRYGIIDYPCAKIVNKDVRSKYKIKQETVSNYYFDTVS